MSMFRRRLMMANALKSSDGNINYPGLISAWSAKGKTNDDAYRAILKDLTGNGHDITLNGFTFSKMSGYGGYPIDFKTEYAPALKINRVSGTLTSSKITITSVKELNNFLESTRIEKHKSYKIKVTGVNDDLYIRYFYSATEYYNIKTEGIHVLPESNEVQFVGFRATKVSDSCNIIIELIPEYPDALVFDGIDDYGFCKNIPLLKDYTIIAKRKDCNGGCLFNKGVNTRGAFILEGFGFTSNTYNFGQGQNKNLLNNDIITWQNKNSYNQQSLIIGNDLDRTNQIIIGKLIDTDTRILKGAFYSAYLFDRSLDEQEIKSFIRKYIDPEYLLPSEIPTPDCYYDFSKGSNDDETRDTIKDYSGNGNDAVAHNFAWSGMSGYGGNLYGNYKYHFDTLGKYQSIILYAPIIGNLKFKVTGLTDYFNKTTNYIELRLIRVSDGGADYKEIKEDGEYNIELPTSKYSTISIRSGGVNIEDGTCNIDIEMLPEYEGALVFDGTNDYVSLDAFDSGFKTMFMKFKPINTINAGYYDQIKKGESKYYFSVSGNSSDIAFSYRNTNGKTYINGILNTSILSKDVVNKTVCIGIVNENVTADNTTIPKIGDGTHFTPWFANMALYKFLGFKEALTEEQIQAVIKKYNLLDGVDEIEVS